MKTLIAMLLAGATGMALANDPSAYRTATKQAADTYKSATKECKSRSGNDKNICLAEAKLAKAKAEADAVASYKDTSATRNKANIAVADAQFDLDRARCNGMSSTDKDNCMTTSRSTHATAVADARAGRTTAQRIGDATTNAVEKTEDMASRAADKTKDLANRAADKTKDVANNASVADTTITTKVKADLLGAKDLKSLGIHVETENGVVMLSGFVNSQAEASRAVEVARGVKGVNEVKSTIQVK